MSNDYSNLLIREQWRCIRPASTYYFTGCFHFAPPNVVLGNNIPLHQDVLGRGFPRVVSGGIYYSTTMETTKVTKQKARIISVNDTKQYVTSILDTFGQNRF